MSLFSKSKPPIFIEVDNVDQLSTFFSFNKKSIMLKDEDFTQRQIEDINDRKRIDAECLATICANTKGKKLEIGTLYGRTTARMAINSPEDLIYTVNITRDQLGESGKDITEIPETEKIGSYYKKLKLKNIRQIYANTKTWTVPSSINDLSVVFIDGCHDYDFVKSDTIKFLPRVKSGGFIVWHDCSLTHRSNFSWIDQSMKAIESVFYTYGLKRYVINVKHSWMGIWKKE